MATIGDYYIRSFFLSGYFDITGGDSTPYNFRSIGSLIFDNLNYTFISEIQLLFILNQNESPADRLTMWLAHAQEYETKNMQIAVQVDGQFVIGQPITISGTTLIMGLIPEANTRIKVQGFLPPSSKAEVFAANTNAETMRAVMGFKLHSFDNGVIREHSKANIAKFVEEIGG